MLLDRQHSAPILLSFGGEGTISLPPIGQRAQKIQITESYIQELIYQHPDCLPITEIDSIFSGPISICTELNTPAGPIDIFMVTPSGLPVIAECKLWQNPEGRRQVVGQILDYAKELSRWSCSDLQREVNRRLKRSGNALLDLVRQVAPNTNEVEFNDALTTNLRRGRFLLLIIGDGIREGVEAIAEYLQAHAGLHFTLGLVEVPIFQLPDGSLLAIPRVLARTKLITRTVLALPDGYAVDDFGEASSTSDAGPDRSEVRDEPQRFWKEFLGHLKLDDPEQPPPNPARLGYISLSLPARTSWLTVYRDMRKGEVGVFLSYWKGSSGEAAVKAVVGDWQMVAAELGGTVKLTERDGRPCIIDALVVGPLAQPEVRLRAFSWLAERVNSFVNVLRPRIRSAAADYEAKDS